MKQEFAIAKEGFLDGAHRAVGETIMLTEKQAEHLLVSGQIARPAAAPTPAPQPSPAGDEPSTSVRT